MDLGKDRQLPLLTPDTSSAESDAGQAVQDNTVGDAGQQPGNDTHQEQELRQTEEEEEERSEEEEQSEEEEEEEYQEEKDDDLVEEEELLDDTLEAVIQEGGHEVEEEEDEATAVAVEGNSEGAASDSEEEGRTGITNHKKHDDSSLSSDAYNSRTKCPLYKITHKYCAWAGPLNDLENHVKTNHAKILKTSPTFECKAVGNKVFLILLNSEIFLYYKHTAGNGNMYVVVQQVGITAERLYEARVTLRDGRYQIISIFPIGKTTEYLEHIFDNRKCAFITEERLYDFAKDNEIDMEVTIKELRKRKRAEDDPPARHS